MVIEIYLYLVSCILIIVFNPMPFFEYTAIDQNQQKVKAIIEARDEEDASQLLSEKGLMVIGLQSRKREMGRELPLLSFLNRVSAKNLVVFARQFSVMLKASMPVVNALRILIKQTANPKLQQIISEVTDEVDGGMKLSQAFARHPHVFSNFFVAMIKSGETSGRLDDILDYLATQQEKDYDLISKIKGAMIYPAFIMCGLIAVGIVMMVVVIPKLTAILQETGGKLPMSTRILIGTSSFMTHYWWLLIIILVILFFIFKYLTKTSSGKRYLDWLAIKLPVFGKLFQRIYLVRFARSLATLSSGGIPLVDSLKITSEIVGNRVYRDIIDRTVKEVEEGNPIASVFIETKEIPAMVSYMVSVGEQTGKLDLVLEKLADFYNREIDNLVANLVSMIEPMIMVVMGVAVGLMVAAIIMPMYNLASSF